MCSKAQNAFRLHAEIYLLVIAQGAEQQAGSEEKNDAEGHLQSDKDFSSCDVAASGGDLRARGLEHEADLGTSHGAERRQSEEHGGEGRDAEGEEKDGCVRREADL